MRNYKEGDRFRFKDSNGATIIWEVLEVKGENYYKSLILESSGPNNSREEGEIETWGVSDFDTYLGNFSKSGNFDNLYNKLNNKWEH